VVETSEKFAAITDNQGRDNAASHALGRVIAQAKSDMREFLNSHSGHLFIGESGSEVLFRLIRTAAFQAQPAGRMLASSLEHPAMHSAMTLWAKRTNRALDVVAHNIETANVSLEDYRRHLGPDLRVASIIHTSPVSGMRVDVAAIAETIHEAAPECIIIVDGIQHACHGDLDLDSWCIDGYAISPYKMFSRHGYGLGWASDRLSTAEKETLLEGPALNWELGTRDTGAYATLSDVVDYFRWLGSQCSDAEEPREQILTAAHAIHQHEQTLSRAILFGYDNLLGLSNIEGITLIGGKDLASREGVISFCLPGVEPADTVTALNDQGIRTHLRKADQYASSVLRPLGLQACVRLSLAHYNTLDEVRQFLSWLNRHYSA
jgi:selenocysteine lyase/cysteine desulfurase